ncbi:protein phosphatase 2C domain-containing protein [Streptomyces sp. NBC_00557]|uniref:protein phosphatase 2C domain-containing protein n=1 Tax=Streptomyces sp. NBC_00557 TaxID=2975776 RepID=UPI002E81AAC2|nr:protein phosphatase 2C domain-containing protein [Streptomyces sp. NBC_00557]WUC34039.1 protein phosphatase 2C domain-containing protein [Streptomyces sp. NBC_00557]
MSQQGGRPARPEDDWWGQLYDDSTADTGPAAAADSLDDRFASAKRTVTGRPFTPPPAQAEPGDDTEGDTAPGNPPAPPHPGPALPAQRAPEAPPAPPPPAPAPPAASSDVPPPRRPTPPEPLRPTERQPREPLRPAEPEPPAPPAEQPAQEPQAPAQPTASAPPAEPQEASPAPAAPTTPPPPPSSVDYVGSGPPTYDPEPTALPVADPDGLGELVADTVLDGARYGACTLRAVSLRGDSARFRGEPRRDSLLTARFGTGENALVLVAMATGVRGAPDAHLAAAEACRWIGRAVGRSHHRLVEDIRAARRGDLKSGLNRLTDRSLGKLRASAAERGVDPEQYTASLRCLLLPADPGCRTRVFFGVGGGGLFRLRDGAWQDIEPQVTAEAGTGVPVVGFGSPPAETPDGDRLTMDFGIPTPPSPYEPAPEPPREPFRFRASIARPGDALLMCTAGLADPLHGEAALCAYLARRWSGRTPPGLAAFLADAQVRVKGYADDRTAAAVWEA